MSFKFIPIVALLLVGVTNALELRQYQSHIGQLISFGDASFALASPNLQQELQWKAVSMSGNQVLIYRANCQRELKPLASLSEPERNMVANVRQQVIGSVGVTPQSSVSTYALDSNSVSISGGNSGISSYNSNGISVTRFDDNNLSYKGVDLPQTLARVFISNDLVTFAYRDGTLQMKPLSCLDVNEQQLVQRIRMRAREMDQNFHQDMQRFQQNMQQMGLNMQQSMQQMNQNLQNQFAHWNPRAPHMGAFGQFPMANNPFAAMTSGNFPFGPNNSPFRPGFPFNA